MELAAAKAFLFDVDGSLVLGDEPGGGGGRALPGAIDVLNKLRRTGRRYVCFTNGCIELPEVYASRLRELGLDVADHEFLTPAVVAAEYLRRHRPGLPVLTIGTEGLTGVLARLGIPLADAGNPRAAGVVLVGSDTGFTAQKLHAACQAIWAGADFLVTNTHRWVPLAGRRAVGLPGAIAAAITHVTEREPQVVGKPAPIALEVAGALLGVRPQELVVVGDDLDAEIRMGIEGGAATVLVLSGATHAAALADLPSAAQPRWVIPDVSHLVPHL